MFMKPLVSVIILNYNGKEFLDDCLSSVLNQTYKNYEIIFVDNASQDGSVDYVRENFSSVKIIENEGNCGYAKGNNTGIKKAKGKYVVILNPDVEVAKDWLEELVKSIEGDKTIASTQSKILLFGDRNRLDGDGGVIHFLGFAWGGNHLKISRKGGRSREIAFPGGASIIVRRNVLNEIGFFDEDLFMYHEDVDLGWRMWLAGYRVLSAPSSEIYHKYSFSRNRMKNYYMERNRFILLLKNCELKTLVLIFPALLFMEIGMIFYSLTKGWFLDKLRGYIYILKNLDRILFKRREVQKIRKVSDKEIFKRFVSRIEFQEIQNPVLDRMVNPILDAYWRFIKKFV